MWLARQTQSACHLQLLSVPQAHTYVALVYPILNVVHNQDSPTVIQAHAFNVKSIRSAQALLQHVSHLVVVGVLRTLNVPR